MPDPDMMFFTCPYCGHESATGIINRRGATLAGDATITCELCKQPNRVEMGVDLHKAKQKA